VVGVRARDKSRTDLKKQQQGKKTFTTLINAWMSRRRDPCRESTEEQYGRKVRKSMDPQHTRQVGQGVAKSDFDPQSGQNPDQRGCINVLRG